MNEEALKRDEIEMVVQVNGKVRDQITVSATATNAEIEAAEKVQSWLENCRRLQFFLH